MKKLLAVFFAATLLVSLASHAAFAASTKTAMQVSNVTIMQQTKGTNQQWVSILTTTLHMPSNQSILITPSLETGLYTNTLVNSKNGATSTSTASASIKIRCVVDGTSYAIPNADGNNGVIYDYRLQQLTATLNGIINLSSCGFVNNVLTCSVTPETIDLLQETMSAHSFVFIFPNVSAGDHTVTVQALIDTNTSSTSTDPTLETSLNSAYATIGLGSLAVEPVGLVNDGSPLVIQ